MGNRLLTDMVIRKLSPSPGRQVDVFDKRIRGFGLRISPGGTKSFFTAYRMGRRNHRLTLGRYPTLTLASARQMAQEALSQVARGIDPATDKLRTRDGYESSLFPAVLDDFIKNYAQRKTRSSQETERILRREFGKPWRKLPIDQITKRTVNDVLDGIVKRGAPSAANHAFAAIRRMLNWTVERGYLDHSPCGGVKAPSKVVSRDRVLSDAEIVAIWWAADKWDIRLVGSFNY